MRNLGSKKESCVILLKLIHNKKRLSSLSTILLKNMKFSTEERKLHEEKSQNFKNFLPFLNFNKTPRILLNEKFWN
jgi:hypothetical protein